MSELKEGDKIYRCYRGRPESFVVIDRVTKTQAISGNWRFKWEYADSGRVSVVGDSGWSFYGYFIETESLNYKFNRLRLVSDIQKKASEDLTDDVLKKLAKAFGLEWKLD